MCDIFDDIICCLEQRRNQGRETIRLDAKTSRDFFAPAVRHRSPAAQSVPPPVVHQAPSVLARSKAVAPASAPPSAALRRPPAPAAPYPGSVPVSASVAEEGVPTDWPALAAMVAGCVKCSLHAKRTQAVFGEGSPSAELMFIGEAPGYHEDQSGHPFVGPAGQLLDRMLQAMQFQREEVYITNIVKCRPPANREPTPEEAAICLPYLNRQIDLVKPRVLVLLGRIPLFYLLKLDGITRLHGQWREYRGIRTMPTFHPSYLLRSPNMKKAAWEDLQKVMLELGRNPEETMAQMRRRAVTGC